MLVICAACGSSDSTTVTAPTSTAPFTITDLKIGTGATAAVGNRITVAYTGWLYNTANTDGKGTQFESSTSTLFTLQSGSLIAGWVQGIPGMKVGGQRRLIIPPELAYGTNGSGSIPGNATLIFDITLLNVQ
ncbi:MAG: FKBP-type peptidyl-prolyl cis-trans isomerase [Acidobacteria bacterium]|nr:FKBP-type peptidyl-prolyl cis-trans isomerase [Acidobacteriota bacterium]